MTGWEPRASMILPVVGGRPVKRVRYATEVDYDKTNTEQDEEANRAFPVVQGRRLGLG